MSPFNSMKQPSSPDSRSPSYRRPADSLTPTYTGHVSSYDASDMHDLERPYNRPKQIMKGYSGHVPISKFTHSNREIDDVVIEEQITEENNSKGKFRSFGKNLATLERYETAIQDLFKRGQTQQMLMRIVQAKLSERVSSYAQQQIWLRNLFGNFDSDGSSGLDEFEFRQCLELMNVQFDDCQSLAIFAYFDKDQNGTIDFDEFSQYAMVPNPKGGTAILAKVGSSNF